ncbi:Nitrate/nitrite sensor protein narX [Trueperella bialowiezensis]|uniref:Nitrate/nitrite sensor protein narX n=2 Tax=Trueperella bialowiezensis TaxID=312285 RepID=A0A448PC18_9ACTO|nr:Nitrate/nitrite sensor protein narX [Trueperella bialowiezensis]
MVAGVCRGLAVHLGGKTWAWRLGCVALAWTGIVPVIYVALALTTPRERPAVAVENQRLAKPLVKLRPDSSKLTAAALIFLLAIIVFGLIIGAGNLYVMNALCVALIVVGAGIAWSSRGSRASTATMLAGLVIAALGAIILVTNSRPSSTFETAILSGIAVLAAAAFVLYPALARSATLVKEIDEQRIREETRADIAAHLHDSVLQTLALIRARADSPHEVRVLARQQEQELRDYLYSNRADADTSLADALTAKARDVENAYGVEIDVVITGDQQPTPAGRALIEAAGEALTNACKHGEGPVSVYGELGEGADVWIRDRGAGFDLGAVAEDRIGIRHSIYGRMERAGGRATIRTPLQSGGTEVHLQLNPQADNRREESL